MKKFILLFLSTLWLMTSLAQTDNNSSEAQMVKISGEVYTKTLEQCNERYKIYPTQNMYNFLKLDTKTGQISRIQWSLEDEKRYETWVSEKYLVEYNDILVNGRFEIYPTENFYNFILLDKINGHTWQFQWGEKAENNLILRIN